MLYYETIKKDETSQWVVFIHGIGGSTLTWKKQIDDFSKNHNILLIDLAGHGKSRDMKSEHNIVGVPHEIKDILDYLNIQKAHFVGMSLGTLILVFYTLIYPDTVLSLTLGGAITSLSINGQIALWFAQVTKKILPQKATCDIFARVLMPKKNHELSRKIFIREALKMKKEAFDLYQSNVLPNARTSHKRSENKVERIFDTIEDVENCIDNPFVNKYCVFTGALSAMTRSEAQQFISKLGGIPENTVTKKTNFLILGDYDYINSIKDGKSNKHKKAEQLLINGQDITIITESVFLELVNPLLKQENKDA